MSWVPRAGGLGRKFLTKWLSASTRHRITSIGRRKLKRRWPATDGRLGFDIVLRMLTDFRLRRLRSKNATAPPCHRENILLPPLQIVCDAYLKKRQKKKARNERAERKALPMRAIKLPEPPFASSGMPEIFEAGVANVIRRAIIISNGFAGAENQSIGLVRALGLSEKQSIHVSFRLPPPTHRFNVCVIGGFLVFSWHVLRPQGGINEWLRWLPVSLHKMVDRIIKRMFGDPPQARRGKTVVPYTAEKFGNAGLSSVLEADAKQIATMARETFEKEGPLLVVASGWDTISVASSIKRLASQNVFVVQIQHPRTHLNRFDLVVTPHHDYYPLTPSGQQQIPRFMRRWITPREPPDGHVVLTVGALHQADSAALRMAAIIWHDEMAPLPKPLLVINIGGPTMINVHLLIKTLAYYVKYHFKTVVTGHCHYGADLARQLVISLDNVLASCGSVRISFSRRTPQKVSNVILNEFRNHPKVYIWDGEDPNPHMGHLAWADAFVITADSVSMLSEACSTGKPVYVIGAERCTWKFSAFHKALQERGVVRPFTGKEDMSESWSYPPLNDAAEAAARVREAVANRGWTLRR
ncbi:hypothetical protein ACLOJK_020500 [Asimina triloba]